MIRWASAFLIFAFIGSGCAPSTVQGLRENHSGRTEFEVQQNYQPVYRTILEQSRTCRQGFHGFVPTYVQGDLYHDTRRGNISVAQHNAIYGILTWLAIDVSALDDNTTRVVAYYTNDHWAPAAQAVEQWVRNDFKGCRFPE
jgi:hypothetical protein